MPDDSPKPRTLRVKLQPDGSIHIDAALVRALGPIPRLELEIDRDDGLADKAPVQQPSVVDLLGVLSSPPGSPPLTRELIRDVAAEAAGARFENSK